MSASSFTIYLVKPTRYDDDGYPVQWWRSLVPSNALACVSDLVDDSIARGVLPGVKVRTVVMDEIHTHIDPRAIIRDIERRAGRGVVFLVSGCRPTRSPAPSTSRCRSGRRAFRSASAASSRIAAAARRSTPRTRSRPPRRPSPSRRQPRPSLGRRRPAADAGRPVPAGVHGLGRAGKAGSRPLGRIPSVGQHRLEEGEHARPAVGAGLYQPVRRAAQHGRHSVHLRVTSAIGGPNRACPAPS